MVSFDRFRQNQECRSEREEGNAGDKNTASAIEFQQKLSSSDAKKEKNPGDHVQLHKNYLTKILYRKETKQNELRAGLDLREPPRCGPD